MKRNGMTWGELIPRLLRGEPETARRVLEAQHAWPWGVVAAGITGGAGLFGAAVGIWSAPTQALYAGIKLPLILFLTALGNGLINAMLAPLLGLNLSARQSLLAVLLCFTMAAAILGAFSPLIAFLAWNSAPPNARSPDAFTSHSLLLLAQSATIAFAGIAANVRLWTLLRNFCGNAQTAKRVLWCWLGGNLLLGSQLSWIFRPIVGSPNLEVQFLRADPMHGSFYESLFRALRHLLFP